MVEKLAKKPLVWINPAEEFDLLASDEKKKKAEDIVHDFFVRTY